MTDEEDLQWVLARLRPTPFGHFTEPLQLHNAGTGPAARAYIRCLRWPNPGFDGYAAAAQSSPGWSYREQGTSHVPYITHPDDLTAVLLEVAG